MLDLPFNDPSTYPGHSGVDFGAPSGSVIKASAGGIVTSSGWINYKAGYGVIVYYPNPNISVLYCHQLLNANRPKVGERVSKGSSLGLVGSTGHSTGPHLHMEIMVGEGAHTYAGIWNYFSRTMLANLEKSDLINVTDEEEDDMLKPKLVRRIGETTIEWSLVAPWLTGNDDKQKGYFVITTEDEAKAAARLYDIGFNNETKVNRADYIEMQKLARKIRIQYLADK